MKPLYILHPGKIRMNTGIIQHFDAEELAELYNVELLRCLIYQPLRKYEDTRDLKYIHLRPRADGNYKLGA